MVVGWWEVRTLLCVLLRGMEVHLQEAAIDLPAVQGSARSGSSHAVKERHHDLALALGPSVQRLYISIALHSTPRAMSNSLNCNRCTPELRKSSGQPFWDMLSLHAYLQILLQVLVAHGLNQVVDYYRARLDFRLEAVIRMQSRPMREAAVAAGAPQACSPACSRTEDR